MQLGDLVDNGPDSAGTLRMMFDLVDAGRGLFILGNHDLKMARALSGDQVRIEALALRVLAAPEVREARREVEDLFHRNPTAATESGRATLEAAVRETVYAAVIDTVAGALWPVASLAR